MNKIPLIIISALCGLFLSACSTTSSVATFVPVTVKNDQAVVYIYRPTEMANALYSPGLNINGEFKLYAKNGVNSHLSLTPGETNFEFQADKTYSSLEPLTLTLESNTNYFIRINTSLKVKNSTGYEPYARSFKLTKVDEQQAVKEISECCFDNNKTLSETTETKSNDKTNNEGFSVDKTQNPFSN